MRSAVGIPFLSALTSGSRQAEGGEDVKLGSNKLTGKTVYDRTVT